MPRLMFTLQQNDRKQAIKRGLVLLFLVLINFALLVHFEVIELFQDTIHEEEGVHVDYVDYFRTTEELLSDNNPHLFNHYTLTLVPINSGMLHLFKNLMCSLARVDPGLVPHITAWAMNKRAVAELHDWSIKNEVLFNYTRDTGLASDLIPVKGYGIFYDSKYIGPGSFEKGGSKKYWKMMKMRKGLYVEVVQKRNLFFMDADIVFYGDPYKDIGIAQNFPNHSDRAENITQLIPDLIYSVDTRDHFRYLDDPYESHKYVPVVCGGLFYARSTHRTVEIFKKLHNLNDDEQHGMNVLLEKEHCNILTDPMPLDLPRRDINRDDCALRESIRLQILDVRKYVNGFTWWKHTDHDDAILDEMNALGEQRMMIHTNVWGVDKKEAMMKKGLWFLDENDMCIAA